MPQITSHEENAQPSVLEEFEKEVSYLETGMAEQLSAYLSFRYEKTLASVYSYLKNLNPKKKENMFRSNLATKILL